MQRRDLQLKSRARIKSIRQKEGEWQQFLFGGVHWTPCERSVIFRRCDHNGLMATVQIFKITDLFLRKFSSQENAEKCRNLQTR